VEFEIDDAWEFVSATVESFHTRVLVRKKDECAA
jgi:hypothetical protein